MLKEPAAVTHRRRRRRALIKKSFLVTAVSLVAAVGLAFAIQSEDEKKAMRFYHAAKDVTLSPWRLTPPEGRSLIVDGKTYVLNIDRLGVDASHTDCPSARVDAWARLSPPEPRGWLRGVLTTRDTFFPHHVCAIP